MIGVNSIHSTGRMRSRSLCSVRSGRDSRDNDPFRYPRTPRSRSLKPLAFPDLLGKTQDGQQHPQSRKKKVEAGGMNMKLYVNFSPYFLSSVH